MPPPTILEDAKDLIDAEHNFEKEVDENYKDEIDDINFKVPIASGSKSENEIYFSVFFILGMNGALSMWVRNTEIYKFQMCKHFWDDIGLDKIRSECQL